MQDVETSRLDDRHKALFRFVDRVNHGSATLTPADLDAVRATGWTDEALYFAITVCALFNFYNRWIDGTGVSDLGPEGYAQSGERMKAHGYAPPGRIVLDR
jgi:hypothetical protein